MRNILIVSQQKNIGRLVEVLEMNNFSVRVVNTAEHGLREFSNRSFCLICFDQSVSFDDGTPFYLFLQSQLWNRNNYLPIIMLTRSRFISHSMYPIVDWLIESKIKSEDFVNGIKSLLESHELLNKEEIFIENNSSNDILFLESELVHKDKQLASLSLQLLKKNELVSRIRVILNSKSELIQDKEIGVIYDAINNENFEEFLVQSFFTQFNRLEPNFFEKMNLKDKLSPSEMRLCVLIRMGMDNKQIAGHLSINTDSVKKALNRLNKKIDIQNKPSLRKYILDLS